MRPQKRLDAPAQVRIAGAGLFQEGRPLGRVVFLHRLEEDRSFTHRALLYNRHCRGRGLRRVVLNVPAVGHRLSMRNRRRNHAMFLQTRCAF
jgi:hypothetical protein